MRRTISGAGLAIVVGALGATPPGVATASASGAEPRQPVRILADSSPPAAHPFAGPTIPQFTASVTTGGKKYTYTLVGKNPATPGTGTTTIYAPIVPVKVTFPGGLVRDATAPDPCNGGKRPIDDILPSPMFTNTTYVWGGTNVGTTQYVDAFRRAEFWNSTKPTGVSPNYHVKLTGHIEPTLLITPPANKTSTLSGSCATVGTVDKDWLVSFLQNTVFHNRFATLQPIMLPIFVFSNVATFHGTPSDCCALGFHPHFNNLAYAGAFQTYIVANFETSGRFTSSKDVSGLSHEVAEWMDDPNGSNPTPKWGHIGQQTGCQGNLEVADPLSGTLKTVMHGTTAYHVQELAFFSWFYHQSPSKGINGWYSNYGKFTTFAKNCT